MADGHGQEPGLADTGELRALAWLKPASLPISTLADPAVASDLLDALGRKLDGSPAAPDYFSRRRNVPIPPELVSLLRDHIERFGTGEDGRLFRSKSGNPIQPSTWWQIWRKVRRLALTPDQLATPLLRRPYDLRHSRITWRLNSGVPPTQIAAWAGHSVEMLLRVYARCVAGLEEVWIARMDATLRPPNAQPDGTPEDHPERGLRAPDGNYDGDEEGR